MDGLEDSINRIWAYFDLFTDSSNGSSVSFHPLYLSDLRFCCGLTTKTNAALSGFADTNDLPLFADRIFELAEDPKKLKEHRSHRGAGVDGLLIAEDIYLAVSQLGQHENEISH